MLLALGKGTYLPNNDFSVQFFGLLQLFAYTHTKFEELNDTSNWSSALLKEGYLNILLHSKNVVNRGWAGQDEEKGLKTEEWGFFSLLLDRLLIVVQLLQCTSSPKLT